MASEIFSARESRANPVNAIKGKATSNSKTDEFASKMISSLPYERQLRWLYDRLANISKDIADFEKSSSYTSSAGVDSKANAFANYMTNYKLSYNQRFSWVYDFMKSVYKERNK